MHSQREVVAKLSGLGLKTRRGKCLAAQTLCKLLRNPIYAGWVFVPKWDLRQPGDFESIVSDELWSTAQAVLDGRQPILVPHERNHPDFPLRRFARCSACDTPLTGSWSKGRNGRYAYYRCRKRECKSVNTRKEAMEDRFIDLLAELRPQPEYLRLFRIIAFFSGGSQVVWSADREARSVALGRVQLREL